MRRPRMNAVTFTLTAGRRINYPMLKKPNLMLTHAQKERVGRKSRFKCKRHPNGFHSRHFHLKSSAQNLLEKSRDFTLKLKSNYTDR